MNPSNRAEAITNVIDGLNFLIIHHANCAASEQWCPGKTEDTSDEYIREHCEWVGKLRMIRELFENHVTGLITTSPYKKEPPPDTGALGD